jgi:hypothetical protein
MGKMSLNILATFAEFEVDLLRMRTREGMAIARANGRLKGKAPELSARQRVHVLGLARTGVHTIAELAEVLTGHRERSVAGVRDDIHEATVRGAPDERHETLVAVRGDSDEHVVNDTRRDRSRVAVALSDGGNAIRDDSTIESSDRPVGVSVEQALLLDLGCAGPAVIADCLGVSSREEDPLRVQRCVTLPRQVLPLELEDLFGRRADVSKFVFERAGLLCVATRWGPSKPGLLASRKDVESHAERCSGAADPIDVDVRAGRRRRPDPAAWAATRQHFLNERGSICLCGWAAQDPENRGQSSIG